MKVKRDENSIFVRLLVADAVQKDLGLTADQKEKLNDFVKVAKERSREHLAKFPEFTVMGVTVNVSEGRKHEFDAWCKDVQGKAKEMRAAIVGMLAPNQRERLKQIRLQHAIAGALTEPEFIKALDLSEEQLARIRAHNTRFAEGVLARGDALNGLPPKEHHLKFIEVARKVDQMQSEANSFAMNVLTPEQCAKLDEFLGKEIAVTWDYDGLTPEDGFP